MKLVHYVVVVVLSFVSGVAGALICIEASTRVPVRTFDTIKAKQIELVGSNGEQCLLMFVSEKGPVNGAAIYMSDTQGELRVSITAATNGPSVHLTSPAKYAGLALDVSDSESCIALRGPTGLYCFTIDAIRSGPRIAMTDTAGKTRLRFGVREAEPTITFLDAAEKLRLAIGKNVTDDDPGWGYRVFDSQGDAVWRSGQ